MKDAQGHGSDGRGGSAARSEFGLLRPPAMAAAAHQVKVEAARNVGLSQLASPSIVRDAVSRADFNSRMFTPQAAPWKSRTTWPARQNARALAMRTGR